MPCTVCQHPECQAIDQALLAQSATLAQLSEQYKLSTSALQRHKQHLQKKMQHIHLRFQDILHQWCLLILNSFLAMTTRVSRTAEAEGNSRLALQAARQGTAIMKFMHKLGFPLTPDSVHQLLASSPAADQESLLPADFKFLLDSRQTLAHSLACPCPEPGSAEDKLLEAGLPGLTDPAQVNQDQLLALLMAMNLSPGGTQCEPHSPQRPKSGKIPGKTQSCKGNNEKYQEDKLLEKIAGMASLSFLAGPPLPAAGNSNLAALLPEGHPAARHPAGLPLSGPCQEQALPPGQAAQT